MKALAALPRLEIELSGRPLAPALSAALGEARVRRDLARPAQVELVFFLAAGESPPLPKAGEPLELRIHDHRRSLFAGEVTAVQIRYGGDGELELRVRGYDLLHRLRKRRPMRAHVESTVADLAREMVSDLGLKVVAAEPGPLEQRLLQHRSNDFELLTEQAARHGLYPVLRASELHLLTLEGSGDAVPLTVGDDVLECRFELNGEPSCRSVEVSAWDPAHGESHRASARHPRIGRRVPIEADPSRFRSDGTVQLAGRRVDNAKAAEAVARGELDRRTGAEVTFWAIAEGNPQLVPGRPVEVEGAVKDFCGRYVLTAVEHRIDGTSGYVTELTTEPPSLPLDRSPRTRREPGLDAAWGKVIRVDDPDGLGRVRATLPARGDLETGWLEVVCPGAGNGKGLVALPDVGDRVLILLLDGEAGHGVVLGGLHGPRKVRDSGVDGGRVRRYNLRTAGGQSLMLDDSADTVRLENSRGTWVELGPKAVRLHAAADLTIEAPGRKLKIRAKTIDFERA